MCLIMMIIMIIMIVKPPEPRRGPGKMQSRNSCSGVAEGGAKQMGAVEVNILKKVAEAGLEVNIL